MRFMLLGPFRIHQGASPVAVPRPRQRALLAYLLLFADQRVSTDRIVEAMWGGAPPGTAKAQVQADVSVIRRVLAGAGAGNRLETEYAGYRFTVRPGELDLADFSSALDAARRAAGQPSEAARMLRKAMAVWRGPALEDVTAPYVEAARAHLDERRLTAYEELADAELALGREATLAVELAPLVQAHPARERLCGQLMTALYRTGRQAESLRAARRLRRHLADQHGLDPGPEVLRIEQMILRADPALRRPGSAAPAQLPATVAYFAGRETQLAQLDALLPAGRTTLVISAIGGTGGVGKTTLAVWWAGRVADRFPDGQLFVNLHGFGPGRPVRPVDALGGFLRALDVPAAEIPVDESEAAALYRTRLAGKSMLIVLDNAGTADQVRPLLPGTPGCLVVVTSRSKLAGLVATEGAYALPLDLLPPAEARDLLAQRIGAARVTAEPEAVDEIVARCAGLPLALAIVAARAATNPGFTLAMLAAELRENDGGLGIFDGEDAATDMRTVFSWSYHQLSPDAARLFRLLGVHCGPDIAAAAVASLAGLGPAEARPLLTELVRAHLVTEHTPGRFGFHDLLRAYAAELARLHDAAADRRAAQHRALDHYLHTAHQAAMLLNAGRDPIKPAGPRDGAVPEELADHGVALGWLSVERPVLQAAIAQAGTEGFDTHAWQLTWTMVNFWARHGHWHDSAAAHRTALDAARRLGDREAQAATHRALAAAYAYLNRYDDAYHQYHRALALFGELGDDAGQAHTYRGLGWMSGRMGRDEEALRHVLRALELFRDPAARASTLSAAGWYHAQLGDFAQSVLAIRQALAVLRETGDRWGQANAWDSLGFAYRKLRDEAEAETCYRHALDLYRDTGDRLPEARMLVHVGDSRIALSDLDGAAAAWREAVGILDELGHAEAADVRAKIDAMALSRVGLLD